MLTGEKKDPAASENRTLWIGLAVIIVAGFGVGLITQRTAPPAASGTSQPGAPERGVAAGFNEGLRLGQVRRTAGLAKPNDVEMESILAESAGRESEAYRSGFKGGYGRAFEN